MALWLSHELVAPEALYQRLDTAVNLLRNQYHYRNPALQQTHYELPVKPNILSVKFDSMGSDAMRAGSYSGWDSLNALFGATGYDTTGYDFGEFGAWVYAELRFAGIFNAESLAVRYSLLEGIDIAYPQELYPQESSLIPSLRNDTLEFLLWNGWGDCFNGCLQNAFSFYREDADSFILVGAMYKNETPELPNWWLDDAYWIWCGQLRGEPCYPDSN